MISVIGYQRIADGIVELAQKMESMLEKGTFCLRRTFLGVANNVWNPLRVT